MFIWLHRVLVVACRVFSFHCGMWLFSCSMWDLVLGPEVEPGLPAWGAWSLSHWTTREVPSVVSHVSLMRKQPAQRVSTLGTSGRLDCWIP